MGFDIRKLLPTQKEKKEMERLELLPWFMNIQKDKWTLGFKSAFSRFLRSDAGKGTIIYLHVSQIYFRWKKMNKLCLQLHYNSLTIQFQFSVYIYSFCIF